MVDQFLAGYHAGFNQEGVWLTPPGVDVNGTSGPFVLRSDQKVEQIMLSGFVQVPAGLTATVIYPNALSMRPHVQMQANINPAREYPHSLGLVGGSGSGATEVVISFVIFDDRLLFQNNNSNDLWVDFIVYSRSIGS
jgi:hypothetical protein